MTRRPDLSPIPAPARNVPALQIPADASPHTRAVLLHLQAMDLHIELEHRIASGQPRLRVTDPFNGDIMVGLYAEDLGAALESWLDAFGTRYLDGSDDVPAGLQMRTYLLEAAEGLDPEYGPYHPVNLHDAFDDMGMPRAEA